MREQHMSLRSLLFVIASLFRLCHCEEHKRRSNLIICLITLSLVLGFTRLAQAADYTFTTIDFPGALGIYANAINNNGCIVGTFYYRWEPSYPYYGFVREVDGSYRKIVFPGSTDTSAIGINDAGQVVGEYLNGSFQDQGYLLSDGVFTTIAFPGAFTTLPMGICNTGKIVGWYSGRNNRNI